MKISMINTMAYLIYSAFVCWMFNFMYTLSNIPVATVDEFQINTLFLGPISTADIVDESWLSENWDEIALLAVTCHYLYLFLVYCFITLSASCGFIIQYQFRSWELPFRSLYHLGQALVVSTCNAIYGRFWETCAITSSCFGYFLDWIIVEDPLCLVISSSGLLITDVLLAFWTANLVVPVSPNTSLNLTEMLPGLAEHSHIVTWHIGEELISEVSWNSYLTEQFFAPLQSYPAKFMEWYDNIHEFDELNHVPVLTCPIVILLLFYACKLLWEEKPQRLTKVELVIEETLLKNALIDDFETYLKSLVHKTDGFMEDMAVNSGLLARALTQIKKLSALYKRMHTEVENLHNNSTTHSRRLEAYMVENTKLHRDNSHLQSEVKELRLSSDAQVHQESMQKLQVQLTSLKTKNVELDRQKKDMQQTLNSIREAKSAADIRATAADKDKETMTIEGSKLREEIERLSQENTSLQHGYQQLFNKNQVLNEEKMAAANASRSYEEMINSLRGTTQTAEEQSRFLQNKLADLETVLNTRSQIAEENVRSLQSELATMRTEHEQKVKELENMKVQEEYAKREKKKRNIQMRKLQRLRQKKLVNMKHTFMTHQQRLYQDIESVRRDNQRLEHRLVQLDPSTQGQTQVIHNPQKDQETRQLKHQLQQQRARNIVLDSDVKQLNEVIERLRRRVAATSSSSEIAQQPATPASPSSMSSSLSSSVMRPHSDELVTLRTELKQKNEELQRLQIQLSNAQALKKGPGSSALRAPPRRK